MKGKIAPGLKFKFEFDGEIPNLNIEIPLEKKESKKTKIVIHKKVKNGRDTSTYNSGLF
jgi:hypothetical protein